MANTTKARASTTGVSLRTRVLGVMGLMVLGCLAFTIVSLRMGGHMMGPTYIAPGNVGLVIDNYTGVVENRLQPAGTHWQGPWETVIEVPTAQRTVTLSAAPGDQGSGGNAVDVNTISNMLQVDVSAQYEIDPTRARDLYASYQDQFANIAYFEEVNLTPSLKGAINYAIGDMDASTAMTTAGKQQAERDALKTLNMEWQPRGITFSNLMIRGVRQDKDAQTLLSTTLAKMQDIENAKLALQQQQFDNATLVQQAVSEAKVNQLQNSTLTDLYVQDRMLSRVRKVYLPSDELMGMLNK